MPLSPRGSGKHHTNLQRQSGSGPGVRPVHVRFGSKADLFGAIRHVRFTPNSDRESGPPHKVMSALPPKADMCGATRDVRFGPKADIRRHLPAAGGQAVRDIKPTHCSIRRCPSWRRQPGRAAGTGRADGRARTVATGVTPAARLCAGRLRIWRDLPDDGKVKNPSDWKCGIHDPIDESARQSSALYRSGRRAH